MMILILPTPFIAAILSAILGFSLRKAKPDHRRLALILIIIPAAMILWFFGGLILLTDPDFTVQTQKIALHGPNLIGFGVTVLACLRVLFLRFRVALTLFTLAIGIFAEFWYLLANFGLFVS